MGQHATREARELLDAGHGLGLLHSDSVNYLDMTTDVQVLLWFWRTGNLVLSSIRFSVGLMVMSGMLTCVLEYTLIGGWKGIVAGKLEQQVRERRERGGEGGGEGGGGGGGEGEGCGLDERMMRLFGFRCVLNNVMLQLRMAYESACALYMYHKYRRGVHDGMSQSKASEGFFEALPQSMVQLFVLLAGAAGLMVVCEGAHTDDYGTLLRSLCLSFFSTGVSVTLLAKQLKLPRKVRARMPCVDRVCYSAWCHPETFVRRVSQPVCRGGLHIVFVLVLVDAVHIILY